MGGGGVRVVEMGEHAVAVGDLVGIAESETEGLNVRPEHRWPNLSARLLMPWS